MLSPGPNLAWVACASLVHHAGSLSLPMNVAIHQPERVISGRRSFFGTVSAGALIGASPAITAGADLPAQQATGNARDGLDFDDAIGIKVGDSLIPSHCSALPFFASVNQPAPIPLATYAFHAPLRQGVLLFFLHCYLAVFTSGAATTGATRQTWRAGPTGDWPPKPQRRCPRPPCRRALPSRTSSSSTFRSIYNSP